MSTKGRDEGAGPVEAAVVRGVKGAVMGSAHAVAAAGSVVGAAARVSSPVLRWSARETSQWGAAAQRGVPAVGHLAEDALAGGGLSEMGERWGRIGRRLPRLPGEGS